MAKKKKKVIKKVAPKEGHADAVETEEEIEVDDDSTDSDADADTQVEDDLKVEAEGDDDNGGLKLDLPDTPKVEEPKKDDPNFKPTFAEAKGSEANQAAKAQAQAESKKKAEAALVKHPTVYSLKGDKVVKLVMKEDRVIQSYIGNMTRNKAELDAAILGWKKAGIWVDAHNLDEAYRQAKLHLKEKAKAKKA